MPRLLLYCCLITFGFGCIKDKSPKSVVVKGRLLQSSSNPVAVSNYKLSFYQGGGSAIIIGSSPSSADFSTNAEGYFECNFPLGSGFFAFIPTSNSNVLSISGIKNNGIQLDWSDVPARDTDLANAYLYKKIHEAVIQIAPTTDIAASDTLYITASTLAGNYSKTITGLFITQNTKVTIDTITDVIFPRYSFQNRMYQNNIAITRNQYLNSDDGDIEFAGDEDEKTYVFIIR